MGREVIWPECRVLVTILDLKVSGSVPVGHTVRTVTHRCRERNAVLTPQGEDAVLVWTLFVVTSPHPHASLAIADLNLYRFPVINHNHERASLSAFWEALQ